MALALGTLLVLGACGQGGERGDSVRASAVAPVVVGEQVDAARRRLEAAGLEPETRERFSLRPWRTVIAQRHGLGERVGRRARVELVVSRGPTPGPGDELRATGLGVLELGASTERVLEVLGRPDRRATRNLGVGPAPEVDWTWRVGRDELELQFDARRRMLTGYCIDSPRLATADGVRVGQVSTGMLARRYGERLVPSRIGPPPGVEPHTLLLSRGRPGTYPALAFTVSAQEVVMRICGGQAPPAGE